MFNSLSCCFIFNFLQESICRDIFFVFFVSSFLGLLVYWDYSNCDNNVSIYIIHIHYTIHDIVERITRIKLNILPMCCVLSGFCLVPTVNPHVTPHHAYHSLHLEVDWINNNKCTFNKYSRPSWILSVYNTMILIKITAYKSALN